MRLLAASLCAAIALAPACAVPSQARRGDAVTDAHEAAVRRAAGQGEAPPPLPAAPKPPDYWRRVAWAGYGAAAVAAGAALGLANDVHGPGGKANTVSALYGVSGAFLGAALSFTWFAHQLEREKAHPQP